ncbi:N-6 DNA methylase [Metasolibacillus meyeri]|uniref:site-specific DNA-methyltransferase (adenine-specific) n=1 Tax=Metasolibacillus meyeri TaxID=1071052 RepID=A0AAW9NZ51_9BACL|nr:N-6 DNA methylase [Metasolibacillus meyeri]MEC1180490.1 N-6 DNA methylase [Metasolibacillus meyeri]
MDRESKSFIEEGVKFLKKSEGDILLSNLHKFFLIYTIAFCSKYIDIKSWKNKRINLYELKKEAKSKLNNLLFDSLDFNDKELESYINWMKLNPPPADTKEDVLGSIYMMILHKSKRKALGEHYTSMDLVELINKNLFCIELSKKRIIDPACGSGNFLISILRNEFENSSKDERERIIEDLEDGEFLVGIDIQELPCIVTKLRLLMEIVYYNKEVDSTLRYPIFQLDSLLTKEIILENNSYDLVITNPPYLRYQLIEESKRVELKKSYNAAVGRFDLYTLFIEKSIELAKDEGEVFILCSDKFMSAEYGKGIRGYVEENAKLVKVIDLNTIAPFNAAVLSAVYQFEKIKNNKKESAEWLKASIKNEKIILEKCGEIDIGAEWRYINENSEELINKIISNSNIILEEIASKISIGIQTTADNVFCKVMSHKFIKDNNLEGELIQPLLRGRNLKKWFYKWDGENNHKDKYILYPYVLEKGRTIPIELSNYPSTAQYLYQHKKTLESRTYFKNKKKKWFEHWTPHSFNFFEDIKILTPEIASECTFSLDVQGHFYNGTAYSIKLNENCDLDDYKYVLALLNSKVINFFHKKTITTHLESGKYRFKSPIMRKYPLVMLNKDNSKYVELVKLVNEILGGTKELKKIEDKINEVVFQIYKLERKDIYILEEYK